MFFKLLELTIHKIYLSQRKYTGRIVDYLTAKYPLMELAYAWKYIVNPKWHFVYALHHGSCDP